MENHYVFIVNGQKLLKLNGLMTLNSFNLVNLE